MTDASEENRGNFTTLNNWLGNGVWMIVTSVGIKKSVLNVRQERDLVSKMSVFGAGRRSITRIESVKTAWGIVYSAMSIKHARSVSGATWASTSSKHASTALNGLFSISGKKPVCPAPLAAWIVTKKGSALAVSQELSSTVFLTSATNVLLPLSGSLEPAPANFAAKTAANAQTKKLAQNALTL